MYCKGQSVSEYAIIMGMIVLIVALVMVATGTNLSDIYCSIDSGLGGGGCEITPASWSSLKGAWSDQGPICNQTYGETQILTENFSGEDFTIHIGSASLYHGDGYGVIFRAVEGEKGVYGYSFQYDPGYGSGAFLFRKWVNGAELAPFEVVWAPEFDWYSPHELDIQVKGSDFSASIDGQQLITTADESYSEGGIGLRTWDNSFACFTDIRVTKP